MPQIALSSGETAEISPKVHRFSVTSRPQKGGQPILRAEGAGGRRIRSIITTSTPDRAGDIIEVKGIDFANYLKNPVVLLQHRADSPVARCVELMSYPDRLEAIAEFAEEGSDPVADLVYRRIKAGIINAVSIGLNPKQDGWEFIDPTDMWKGVRYTKTDMLEFSFVALPMNPEALIVQRSLDDEELRQFEAIGRELAPQLLREEPAAPEAEPAPPEQSVGEDPCNPADDAAKKNVAARLRRVQVERLRLTS